MASRAIKGKHVGRSSGGYYNDANDTSADSIRHSYPASTTSNMSHRSRPTSESSSIRSSVPASSQQNGHAKKAADVGLKKQVGLISGTALIVGTMIGSGIFISPTGVINGTGSVGLCLVVWVVCGLLALLGALSFAELGTMIPKSGGEYIYLLETFRPINGTVGDIPAFLLAWMNVIMLRPAMVAIILLAFATYALEPFFEVCHRSESAIKILAVFATLLLLIINCLSVKLATVVQNVFTVLKIASLVIIIIGGFVRLGQGHTKYLSNSFEGTSNEPGKIAIAIYYGMWAYDGWNNLNYVTEELINPYKNLPLAIGIGIPIVTVLYLLVNISYFTVLSAADMIASPAVAVTWGDNVLGVMSWVIPVAVACSTFGAANGTFFSAGRITFSAAREGHMMELLSMVHVKRSTPLPSLVLTCLIALLMIIGGNIASLIDFFSFAVWMFYGLTMAALLVLRWTRKDDVRPYKVPIFIPIIVLIASIYLVIAPIIDNPQLEFLYAALIILAGLIFYIPFVYKKWVLPGTEGFTLFMQFLMEVSTPTEDSTSMSVSGESRI